MTITEGSNSWLKALKELIAESDHIMKDFPLDWLEDGTNSAYHNLDLSIKLSLLNFLCDEALGTRYGFHVNEKMALLCILLLFCCFFSLSIFSLSLLSS